MSLISRCDPAVGRKKEEVDFFQERRWISFKRGGGFLLRYVRGGFLSREELDFFCNNETLKIDGRLPFVTEPIVTSYNVPSQGSEKCTMGEEMKGS